MASEPMSDARLAEIREQVDEYARKVWIPDDVMLGFGLHELLAEVERLRAREAALLVHQRATQEDIIEGRAREAALVHLARTIAEMPVTYSAYVPTFISPTLREQARALLAAAPTDVTTQE